MRAGLFWTALGLGAATISYACDPQLADQSLGFDGTLSTIFFTLVPIPALALGVRGLALALRLGKASDLAGRTAAELAERLPNGFVVVPHYRPHDGGEDEIGLIVIGPSRVFVVETCDDRGEILCSEDQWYGRRAYGVGRRLRGGSPSQRARRNAARVRRDVASGGFLHTEVEPLVLFAHGRLVEAAGSSVPAFDRMDALVERLADEPEDASAYRTGALANALVGPVRLVAV